MTRLPSASAPIRVTDMHTGGEPVRIIDARDPASGWPEPSGDTILEKRAFARDRQDHLRRFLMHEPRGHHDMYGALIVRSDLPGADFGALFLHNEGWSTMCGHAVIALGRFAVEEGWVKATEPETRVGIECPCGLVIARVSVRDGQAGAVRFESVPAFLLAADQSLALDGHGPIAFDIAYGGAFYAIAEASAFGLDLKADPVRRIVEAADALTQAVKAAHRIEHPDAVDLGFLYGAILTDGGDGRNAPTRNICVFADREVDRSPTGSGVTARLALMAAKGQITTDDERSFESVTGAIFSGRILRSTACGPHDAIIAEIGGIAYRSGTATFHADPGDPLGGGFILR